MSETALFGNYARSNIEVDHGEGVWLVGKDGRRFLDCGSGIAVNALGHCHPHLVSALQDQAAKLWHTSNLHKIPGGERLAQRLVDNTFAEKVLFVNSGAEAMEAAIKCARRYQYNNGNPDRYHIVTFEGAFHGRTIATIAAGGQAKYLEGFGPKAPGFDQTTPGDLEALKQVIGPQTAAIAIEPIQGEGGIKEMHADFLRGVRRLCDEHGILLIFDEIQTGVGRTGKLFAHQLIGVEPDLMAVAKGIGGGFPMGACLATAEAAEALAPGTHGTTFGGNPLAMAVGNAVLDVVLEDGFLEEVQAKGLSFKQKLAGLVDSHPKVFAEVRGVGLMLGIRCTVPVGDYVALARDAGLLAVPAGDNVARILPPLTISEDEISMAVERLEQAAAAMEANMVEGAAE
ncbi:aspartate aminotransferase family protein [Roseibium denhamense]|uniref:Acetylornithine aminotransferase n=1 Tax=Roseibium denhamense TaxID=76305 RepID=A0ABY1P4G5_9HYPH|nr:aspartate aminotransferase family protein [Roseibium denhamense]MTI07277.1 aspartate aminotransferase family protein [Roseibium denhamense]SMP26135.1 acetylornithine/N-succinyldiaminopimelate aminotransferase [Roseibium denhamense]